MNERTPKPIRVLIVDDEAEVRDAYRQILTSSEASLEMTGFHELRSRLFRKDPAEALRRAAAARTATAFEPVFCDQAAQAVATVKDALARNEPFALAFIDVRMPPGQDGVWAAMQIRELDPAIEIVICTAYSDADPMEIGGQVPPEDKLSYLQKPFHPHEVRQMTIALASKWRAEHRIVKLAYFDALTGLPNRCSGGCATARDSAVRKAHRIRLISRCDARRATCSPRRSSSAGSREDETASADMRAFPQA